MGQARHIELWQHNVDNLRSRRSQYVLTCRHASCLWICTRSSPTLSILGLLWCWMFGSLENAGPSPHREHLINREQSMGYSGLELAFCNVGSLQCNHLLAMVCVECSHSMRGTIAARMQGTRHASSTSRQNSVTLLWRHATKLALPLPTPAAPLLKTSCPTSRQQSESVQPAKRQKHASSHKPPPRNRLNNNGPEVNAPQPHWLPHGAGLHCRRPPQGPQHR